MVLLLFKQLIYDYGSFLEDKLASVIRGRGWNWSPARSEDLVHIQSQLPNLNIGDANKAIWVTSKKKKKNPKRKEEMKTLMQPACLIAGIRSF